ncbi:MAG: S4 domain-containing protein [Hyphomonadaceae bacterium]|nr:S4 domain-containing protein [Hyphomonadaceae bacterium]
MSRAEERCRLDVWLWRARFFKTRSLAGAAVEAGGLFVERNGQSRSVAKAATRVQPGDGVSFRLGADIRTVRVVAVGVRRGPAAEARALYVELEPALDGSDGADHSEAAHGAAAPGSAAHGSPDRAGSDQEHDPR